MSGRRSRRNRAVASWSRSPAGHGRLRRDRPVRGADSRVAPPPTRSSPTSRSPASTSTCRGPDHLVAREASLTGPGRACRRSHRSVSSSAPPPWRRRTPRPAESPRCVSAVPLPPCSGGGRPIRRGNHECLIGEARRRAGRGRPPGSRRQPGRRVAPAGHGRIRRDTGVRRTAPVPAGWSRLD